MHIDGTVYGAVRANSCVVDMNGFVQGEIIAGEVFVRGRVIGPISGNSVNLYAGAQVEGDIVNQSISIENGANVYGMISRMDQPIDVANAIPQASANDPGFGSSSSMNFTQDNSFERQQPENVFRPLRVVKPR